MPVTVATWNLQGSAGVDAGGVAEFLNRVGPDVVFLQEVQREQAHAIAGAVGAASLGWALKHWPIRVPAEGMAVIGVGNAVPVVTRSVTHRFRYWSWRRRIMQRARFEVDGIAVAAVNAHLSPHDAARARRREVDAALDWLDDVRGSVVVGDLNEKPGGPALRRLTAAGLSDAWEGAGSRTGVAETNWSGSRAAAPDQRLDYVFHGEALRAASASGVDPSNRADWSRWATLSDHVPLLVVLAAAPTA